MDYGFGPKVSRVAAGVCLLFFLGTLRYFFGRWVWTIPLLLVLAVLLLALILPRNLAVRQLSGFTAWTMDLEHPFGWLEDRFESLLTRLRL